MQVKDISQCLPAQADRFVHARAHDLTVIVSGQILNLKTTKLTRSFDKRSLILNFCPEKVHLKGMLAIILATW